MFPFFFIPIVGLIRICEALPWNGPQQTDGATETADWSPVPTGYRGYGGVYGKEESFLELIRRDLFPVSVCGWIGGQASVPAFCSTQSSCVWNSDNSYVGCCAIQSSECKFYTSCVDINSPDQVGDRDNVFTCKGTSVCYTNHYPDNYIQWGCGSAEWATTVLTSFDGIGDQSLQIVITGNDSPPSPSPSPSPTPSPEPSTSTPPPEPSTSTSSPEPSSTSSEESSSESSSESSIEFSSSSSIESQTTSLQSSESTPSSSDESTPPSTSPSTQQSTTPPAQTSPSPSPTDPAAIKSHSPTTSVPIGPIIGGAIGGVALIAGIVAIVVIGWKRGWFTRKQRYEMANIREGSAYLDGNAVYELPGGIGGQKTGGQMGGGQGEGRWKVGVGYVDGGGDLGEGGGRKGKRLSELA